MSKPLKYSLITDIYEEIEATTKRLEMTDLLVELFRKTPESVIGKVVYLTQGKLYPDFMGIEIGIAEKMAVRAIALASGHSIKEIEDDYEKTGDLGDTAQRFLEKKKQVVLFSEPLTVESVYETLDKMAKTTGQGSADQKLSLLAGLLANATPTEAKHIVRTVTGKLRLGIGDMTVLDALAIAYTGDKANRPALERAYNLSSDLGFVAETVAKKGMEGIKKFKIIVGKPIRPMLAERLPTAKEILEKLGGEGAAEYKLDGERLQIHKKGKEIHIFSRRLENISGHYPDAIELARTHIKAEEAIVECEAVAVDPNSGDLMPFQELMHRRRKYGIEEAMKLYPVSLFMFDVLYVDGEDCTLKPYTERREKLEQIIIQDDQVRLVQRIVTGDLEKLEAFFEQAIQDGCEGLLLKDLNSIYRAGSREFSWIKWKREYQSELTDTIDLTIVGAFYGRGRRAGKYGAFLLAAYDHEADMFRTACKCGTGFTDEDLERFPKLLESYRIPHKHSRVDSKLEANVWFVPKIVIETIAAEITLSPIHTCGMDAIRKGSGLALRFPKYTGRLRDDKGPEDATTVKEIIEMYQSQLKRIATSETEAETP
jgi:DNA ligase-1